MSKQKELVRLCFEERTERSNDVSTLPSESERLTDERLANESESLFEAIHESGVERESDTFSWASIDAAAGESHLSVRPVGASLRNGRCGIGLFGAGLYAITDNDRYRRFALEAIRPVREAIASEQTLPSFRNHGGAIGVGSVLYGLSAIGTLVGEASLLDDVTELGSSLPADLLESSDESDVSNGSAGTMLGLLAGYDRTGSSELLTSATELGDRLLESRVEVENGVRVWTTPNSRRPLTGFAHGVGGIAYALVRLGDATGNRAYRDAAMESLRYEFDRYSESNENWPDLRDGDSPQYLDAWCHGRSGTGLARLGMSEYVTDDVVSAGIDRACEGFPMELVEYDNLCCGNAGRTEFLLEANRHRSASVGNPRDLLGKMLARKSRSGGYTLPTRTERTTDPTLFDGVAGIGYAMLRVIDPDTLPCLLQWE